MDVRQSYIDYCARELAANGTELSTFPIWYRSSEEGVEPEDVTEEVKMQAQSLNYVIDEDPSPDSPEPTQIPLPLE